MEEKAEDAISGQRFLPRCGSLSQLKYKIGYKAHVTLRGVCGEEP